MRNLRHDSAVIETFFQCKDCNTKRSVHKHTHTHTLSLMLNIKQIRDHKSVPNGNKLNKITVSVRLQINRDFKDVLYFIKAKRVLG